MKKKYIWVVYLKSESGDDYGPFKFDHEPTDEELSKICHDSDGREDWWAEDGSDDGPGFDGSYCDIEHMDKIEI